MTVTNKKTSIILTLIFPFLIQGCDFLCERFPDSPWCRSDPKSIDLAPENNRFEVSQDEDGDLSTLSIHTSISKISLVPVSTEKGMFIKVQSPGLIPTFGIGGPDLPVFSQLIEVPLNATLKYPEVKRSYEEIDLKDHDIYYKVIPAQPPQMKNAVREFKYDKAAYRKMGFIKKEVISFEDLGILRSSRLVRIEISPIDYNPKANKLRIINNLKIKVKFEDSDYKKTRYLKEKYSSPLFNDMLRRVVPNFKPLMLNPPQFAAMEKNPISIELEEPDKTLVPNVPSRPVMKTNPTVPTTHANTTRPLESVTLNINKLSNLSQATTISSFSVIPVTYVILAHESFKSNQKLTEFIKWKEDLGYKVVVAYCGDYNSEQEDYNSEPAKIADNVDSIKTYLKKIYDNPQTGFLPHQYLLLVGDTKLIPPNPDKYLYDPDGDGPQAEEPNYYGDHPTDLYYAEYTEDTLPDVFYGRFSANTSGELDGQISKTIEYEKRYQGIIQGDLSYLSNAVLVSGNDIFAPYAKAVESATEHYFNTNNGITATSYICADLKDPTVRPNFRNDIMEKINEGIGIVYYAGHGTPEGWFHSHNSAAPYFLEISDISALSNKNKYGLWIGNCCNANKFDELTCFGEAALRALEKGAIGYIGASNLTAKYEDLWWAIGLPKENSNTLVYAQFNLGAFDRLFHIHGEDPEKWCSTHGQIIIAGNLAVSESTSPLKTYYWEIYHLMGDPSLSVFPVPDNSGLTPEPESENETGDEIP